jgi:hypothetical protein
VRTFPFLFGGSLDEPQKAYAVLRSAEGIGGFASNEYGIDGLWRRARALALAAAGSPYRRAISNAFPFLATDLIPYYERLLGLRAAPDSTETDRRNAVAAAWIAKASAALPDILAELQAIDARSSLIPVSDDNHITSHDGRWLGGLDPSEPTFGTPNVALTAAYTTRYILRVRFANSRVGKLLPSERIIMAAAKSKLRALLPPWWDWTITTSTGFLCDTSPMDITGLSA